MQCDQSVRTVFRVWDDETCGFIPLLIFRHVITKTLLGASSVFPQLKKNMLYTCNEYLNAADSNLHAS